MERERRTVLFAVMTVLSVICLIKSHRTGDFRPVAFVHQDRRLLKIKVSGDVDSPGIYTFSSRPELDTVIKMTIPFCPLPDTSCYPAKTPVNTGQTVTITCRQRQPADISLKTMKASERILLDVPLELDRMTLEDWESLPGIGPATARNIEEERHICGGFRRIEELSRVPLMGEKKINRLKRYF
jgi:competence protein ComEA